MHLEMPTESALSTFHACQKAGIDDEEPDVGPVPGRDYKAWMDDVEDVIVWPSDESLLSEYDMVPKPSLISSSSRHDGGPRSGSSSHPDSNPPPPAPI